jgi:hypothetical protein
MGNGATLPAVAGKGPVNVVLAEPKYVHSLATDDVVVNTFGSAVPAKLMAFNVALDPLVFVYAAVSVLDTLGTTMDLTVVI